MIERLAEYTSPYTERLKLKEQYTIMVDTLNEAGLLELLENGRTGIYGIDGKEYELPRYEAITQAIAESESWLEEKEEQGFAELSIVPVAIALSRQFKAVGNEIRKHGEHKTLLSPGNPPTPLDVDLSTPLYRWDNWERSDEEGRLLYYPKRFEKDSGGVTKKELLKTMESSRFPGFLIHLEEPTEIPAEGKGETKGGRRQLEENRSSRQYLQTLSEQPYGHEEGPTIDGWIARLLRRLKTRNEVIDDWNGIGKLCYLTGNYGPASGDLPCGCWYRDLRLAWMDERGPDLRLGGSGSRSAVRIR